MNRFLRFVITLTGLAALAVLLIAALMPWMDRWGATNAEIVTSFTGDELVPSPRITYTRAITIQASPEQIYPWIVQLGAEKGGMYSYSWFETNILRCELINADRIHEEWQNLKVGDPMKMCPGTSGPPPYTIAIIEPNHAIVMGHKDQGEWVEVWQFLLVPQEDGTTRLVIRSRNAAQGVLWDVIRPGEFIMMHGMMLGIKERAEATDLSSVPQIIPTPEVFNPLNPSPTPSNSTLPMTCQVTDLNVYIDPEGAYCFAYPKRFTLGTQPLFDMPAVIGPAIGSGEPVYATFAVEVGPYKSSQSLDQQVDEFLKGYTVAAPESLTRAVLSVARESAVMVDVVPVQLSWRIVFVPHQGQLYRLMYWPVDLPDAKADIEALYQTTLNSFAFLK